MPLHPPIHSPICKVRSKAFVLALAGILLSPFGTSTAFAACAISIGNGEGPTQAIAERRARRDAEAKIGTTRPSNADYSEPACYVADNFAAGVATYGCEVQLSYCINPEPPVQEVRKPRPDFDLNKRFAGKHHKHRDLVWNISKAHGKRHGDRNHGEYRGHGTLAVGGWGRTQTRISCLRFNAKASGRNVNEASNLANGALIQSIAANVGADFSHGRVEATGPTCSQTGNHKFTCLQTARYCF